LQTTENLENMGLEPSTAVQEEGGGAGPSEEDEDEGITGAPPTASVSNNLGAGKGTSL